ncbi:hypothetical protein, partial [Burkholderia sp. 28_3]|uniref:hypothetical protein n=1 Tax=Burkholderia sp. 28_3 TaxID=2183921 RepID=UPI0011B93FCA
MDFGLPRTANPLTRPAPGWLTPTIRSVEIRIRSRYTIHPYLRRREIPRETLINGPTSEVAGEMASNFLDDEANRRSI